MRRGMVIVAAATLAFGAAHSVLAGPAAKGLAVRVLGEQAAAGVYRPAYNLLSVAMFVLLVVVIRRQPGREVYHVRGGWAWAMRAGQLLTVAFALWGLWHAGVGEFVGWDSVSAWWRGTDVPRIPEGQGPGLNPDGSVRATGPFAGSRQPLNWVFLPLLWLNPRVRTRLLAFNLAVSAYLVAGAAHSDWHLGMAYGPAYDDYRARVPFVAG